MPSFKTLRLLAPILSVLLLPSCTNIPSRSVSHKAVKKEIHSNSLEFPLTTSPRFGIGVKLIIPAGGSIESREPKPHGEKIRFKLTEDTPSERFLVRITDQKDRLLWEHAFSYNGSSPGGNSVEVVTHPTLPFLSVAYEGYKWDHSSVLLRVKQNAFSTVIAEDPRFESAVLDWVNRQDPGTGYGYDIEIGEFTETGIRFTCTRLKKDLSRSVHPVEQEEAATFSGIVKMGESGGLVAE